MSIAGGYYKAVDAVAALKMDCVQIFTKNKPMADEADFRRGRQSVSRFERVNRHQVALRADDSNLPNDPPPPTVVKASNST